MMKDLMTNIGMTEEELAEIGLIFRKPDDYDEPSL